MEWRKYSLPHVVYDQYKTNTHKGYGSKVLNGDSIFLAHLSNHKDAPNAVVVWSLLWSIPVVLLTHPVMTLFAPGMILLATVTVLGALDTYSTIKWRVRLEAKNSINWILDPEAHTKRRSWW